VKKEPRIIVGKHYLYRGRFAKILSKNENKNTIVLYLYDINKKEQIEFDTSKFFLIPLFKIGDVAKMVGRKQNTIRKYEKIGLISEPKRYMMESVPVRFYTEEDIEELAIFFATRPSPGQRERNISRLNRINLKKGLDLRFK